MIAAPALPLPCQRDQFDLPRDVAYLNCAYMGPLPRTALEAGLAGIRRKARPWSITSAEFFEAAEQLRALAARLIGATADDLAIVPSVSYGMGVAANVPLRAGQRVLMLDEEFPSTTGSSTWSGSAAAPGRSGPRWRSTPRNRLARFPLTLPLSSRITWSPRHTSGSWGLTPSGSCTWRRSAREGSRWSTTGWPGRGRRTSRG